MGRVLAMPYETRGRILDTVRRVELAMLLMTGALFGFYYQPWGVFFALPMLATAVVLVPRERPAAAPTREQLREGFLQRAEAEGIALRALYVEIRGRAPSSARTHALKQIRREIRIWINAMQARFANYPEFAAIFRAYDKQGGILERLDSRLICLRELSRLCRISDKLRLPI